MSSIILKPRIDDSKLPTAQRKGVISCTQLPISHYIAYDHLSYVAWNLASNLSNIEIPLGIEEALRSPIWKQAIMEEMDALAKNGTWEVVKKPKGKVPVGC